MQETRYDMNKTMNLLGKQYYMNYVTDKDYQELRDVFAGNTGCNPRLFSGFFSNMLLDAFVLGAMKGKRIERARKKNRV